MYVFVLICMNQLEYIFINMKMKEYLCMNIGKGVMAQSLEFRTDYSSPILLITKAVYGNFSDVRKVNILIKILIYLNI